MRVLRWVRIHSCRWRPFPCSPSAQVDDKVVSRGQGMGVVIAQHLAVASQNVLVECTGPVVLTQCALVDGGIVS
jgi:hypothetical protein